MATGTSPGVASPVKYPSIGFPLVFAESVPSIFLGSGIVKFYLARINNPVIPAAHPPETAISLLPICQVAMPIDTFVNTVVFFDLYLENLVKGGTVKQEVVDRMRAQFKAPTQNA